MTILPNFTTIKKMVKSSSITSSFRESNDHWIVNFIIAPLGLQMPLLINSNLQPYGAVIPNKRSRLDPSMKPYIENGQP